MEVKVPRLQASTFLHIHRSRRSGWNLGKGIGNIFKQFNGSAIERHSKVLFPPMAYPHFFCGTCQERHLAGISISDASVFHHWDISDVVGKWVEVLLFGTFYTIVSGGALELVSWLGISICFMLYIMDAMSWKFKISSLEISLSTTNSLSRTLLKWVLCTYMLRISLCPFPVPLLRIWEFNIFLCQCHTDSLLHWRTFLLLEPNSALLKWDI